MKYKVDNFRRDGFFDIYMPEVTANGGRVTNAHPPVLEGLSSKGDAEYFCNLLNNGKDPETLILEITRILRDPQFNESPISLTDWHMASYGMPSRKSPSL